MGHTCSFQIDGNFGGTAGVTEMLIQSHAGFIQLLPALPDEWAEGSVSGLCAKGDFEISMSWEKGQLKKAIILSKAGSPCLLKYGQAELRFNTQKGKNYSIELKNEKLVKL